MDYEDPDRNYVERLKHPEREAGMRSKAGAGGRYFALRQLLNVLFILMAVVAMVGIAVGWSGGGVPVWAYPLALVSVLIKMVEAMLRMPGMLRRTTRRTTAKAGEREAGQNK